jgi:1,4-dihydroxy-2-naphthoate octaprenyltransferase
MDEYRRYGAISNSTSGRVIRLARAQFIPVIISPVLVGTALAWSVQRAFVPLIFALALLASVLLHLGANAIDDVYDFESGVDVMSNNMFPADFGGWKVLPRGLMTFKRAKLLAYSFLILAVGIGFYLAYVAGPIVLVLGLVGVFFAYFHVAPPLRLGYRGLGLSEFGIFLSFGILPVLGSYYIQTSNVSMLSLLMGIPPGLLTVCVLVNHDQIFFDPYSKAGKRSFTVTVGRRTAMLTTAVLTLFSYLIILGAIVARLLPVLSGLVFFTLPLFLFQLRLYSTPAASPLHYVKLTQATMALSVLFGVLLALGLIVG